MALATQVVGGTDSPSILSGTGRSWDGAFGPRDQPGADRVKALTLRTLGFNNNTKGNR